MGTLRKRERTKSISKKEGKMYLKNVKLGKRECIKNINKKGKEILRKKEWDIREKEKG